MNFQFFDEEIIMTVSNAPGGRCMDAQSAIWHGASAACLGLPARCLQRRQRIGTTDTDRNPIPQRPVCVPSDPATADECGTLMLGLTDADGDFDSYTVDVVVASKLEKANGAVFEALPARTRIDFTEYVDLTEFVLAATVQPGVYVGGSITLDYTDAEVFVEVGDDSKEATVVDASGAPLGLTTRSTFGLTIVIDC